MDLLGELNAKGTTIMLVTHDGKVAARTSRVLYLVDEHIVGDRDRSPYHGDGLEERYTAPTGWLLAQAV